MLGCVPYWLNPNLKGTYKSMVKYDEKHPGKGRNPAFQIRIAPELKSQFEVAAKEAGMSLGNWLKTLGRKELERLKK